MGSTLRTLEKKRPFRYNGSVSTGTTIYYGKKPFCKEVTPEQYKMILQHFKGQTIPLGAIFEPEYRQIGSLGEYIARTFGIKTSIASYLAPILVDEGFCSFREVRTERNKKYILIRFFD